MVYPDRNADSVGPSWSVYCNGVPMTTGAASTGVKHVLASAAVIQKVRLLQCIVLAPMWLTAPPVEHRSIQAILPLGDGMLFISPNSGFFRANAVAPAPDH
jgi:hypothetical protein